MYHVLWGDWSDDPAPVEQVWVVGARLHFQHRNFNLLLGCVFYE